MPLLPVEELDRMPEPFEMFELMDGQAVELRIEKWQQGKTLIHPRDGREAHDIPVLRVWVPEADKPDLPQYWDITSKHLIAGLLGYLETTPDRSHVFHVVKHGKAPTCRFTLEALPVA